MFRLILFNFLLCLVSVVSQDEGSRCTLDGFPGRCVEMKRCFSVIQTLKEKKRPQMCSSTGATSLVCCTDCKLVDDINDITIDPQRGVLYKDHRKAWNYCLDSLKRLPYPCKQHFFYDLVKDWDDNKKCHNVRFTAVGAAGGKDAQRGEFPFMALLGYGDDLDDVEWLCGGSIITDKFILTAGHCSASGELGPVTYAAVGILKRSDPEHLWKRHRVQDIIRHPEYRPPSKYHDIALLRLVQKIQFFDLALPACLPSKESPLHFTWGVAVGWGALGHRKQLADTLQKVTIQKFEVNDCNALYRPHRHLKQGFNSSTQLCYGDKSQVKDTCPGDSGGPLHLSNGCAFDIVGVTSYGRPCGFAGDAGIYTRVLFYVPWIEGVVWPGGVGGVGGVGGAGGNLAEDRVRIEGFDTGRIANSEKDRIANNGEDRIANFGEDRIANFDKNFGSDLGDFNAGRFKDRIANFGKDFGEERIANFDTDRIKDSIRDRIANFGKDFGEERIANFGKDFGEDFGKDIKVDDVVSDFDGFFDSIRRRLKQHGA